MKTFLLFFARPLSYGISGIGERVCHGLSLGLNTLMLFAAVLESCTLSGFLFILQRYVSSDPFRNLYT